MVKKWLVGLTVLALLVPFATLSFAQESSVKGNVGGLVVDSTGAVIPAANVTLTGATGSKTDKTDEAGNFMFSQLTLGYYSVKVEKQGFKTATVKSVEVLVGKTQTLRVTLEPGAVSEIVEVTALATVIDTTSTAVGANLPDSFYQSVPVPRAVSGLFYITKVLNQATIESKEQASKKAKYDVERAERALAQMTLRAPSAGTISLLQHWSGSNMTSYRPGDRAWPGAAIAELPDATTLRISARVDETERGRLAEKQPVTVQLNAIPDRQFTGHIDQIGAIASMDFSSGWPITRNFILEIVLDQTDPRFKPGLTGQVTVIVDRVPNAITLPAQAMFQKSGQNVAYVWRRTQFEERAIEVGKRSGDRIMVAKGVSPGEQVALKDPTLKE